MPLTIILQETSQSSEAVRFEQMLNAFAELDISFDQRMAEAIAHENVLLRTVAVSRVLNIWKCQLIFEPEKAAFHSQSPPIFCAHCEDSVETHLIPRPLYRGSTLHPTHVLKTCLTSPLTSFRTCFSDFRSAALPSRSMRISAIYRSAISFYKFFCLWLRLHPPSPRLWCRVNRVNISK